MLIILCSQVGSSFGRRCKEAMEGQDSDWEQDDSIMLAKYGVCTCFYQCSITPKFFADAVLWPQGRGTRKGFRTNSNFRTGIPLNTKSQC